MKTAQFPTELEMANNRNAKLEQEIAKANTQIHLLQSQLDEANKDKVRLDWIEEMLVRFVYLPKHTYTQFSQTFAKPSTQQCKTRRQSSMTTEDIYFLVCCMLLLTYGIWFTFAANK